MAEKQCNLLKNGGSGVTISTLNIKYSNSAAKTIQAGRNDAISLSKEGSISTTGYTYSGIVEVNTGAWGIVIESVSTTSMKVYNTSVSDQTIAAKDAYVTMRYIKVET